MANVKQRDFYFDNLKFILILMVVVGHFMEPLIERDPLARTVYLIFYTFHMPAFVLLSGFFSKIDRSPFKINLMVKFLIPYIVFQLLFYAFAHVFLPNQYQAGPETIFKPAYIYWYLPALLAWNLILPLFVKLKFVTSLILSILLGLAAGYFDFIDGTFTLSRILVFLPFFLIGYFLKKEDFIRLREVVTTKAALLIIASTVFLVLTFGAQMDHRWLWGYFPYEKFADFKWYAGAFRLMLYMLSAAMTLAFIALVPTKQKPYTLLGTRTLAIYLLHGFLVKIYFVIFSVEVFDSLVGFFILLATGIATTLLLASRFITKLFNPIISPRLFKI